MIQILDAILSNTMRNKRQARLFQKHRIEMQSTNSEWYNRRYTTIVVLFCFLLISLAEGCSDSSRTTSSKTKIRLESSEVDVKTLDFKKLFLQRQEVCLDNPKENGFRDLILAFGPVVLNTSLRLESWEAFLSSDETEVKRFRENEWAYNCEKFGIDPTAEPRFWNRPELFDLLFQTEIYVDSTRSEPIDVEWPTKSERWTSEELDVIGRWVQERTEIFAIYESAINKETFGAFLYPRESFYLKNKNCYYFCEKVADALRIRANYRAATRDFSGALEDQRLILRLGRQILDVETNQVHEIAAGLSILTSGMEALTSLVEAGDDFDALLARQAAIVDEALGNFDWKTTAERSLKNERLFEALPRAVYMAEKATPKERAMEFCILADEMCSYHFNGEDIEKALRSLDADAFLGRFIDFCHAYCREDFDYANSKFFIRFDSWKLSRFNFSDVSRSRAWADVLGGVTPDCQQCREWFRQTHCKYNLLRLQNAILQYQAENGTLPPAFTVDEAGKPLHSWRVLILPYLGEKERELFSKIRLDEPWDSDYNRQYQTETPGVYHCPSQSAEGACYSVVVGPNSLFDESGAGKNLIELANDSEKNALGQALVVERSSPVCWMRPDAEISEEFAKDVNSDDDIPVSESAGIGSAHNRTINIANASGSVRALNKEVKTEKEMEVW